MLYTHFFRSPFYSQDWIWPEHIVFFRARNSVYKIVPLKTAKKRIYPFVRSKHGFLQGRKKAEEIILSQNGKIEKAMRKRHPVPLTNTPIQPGAQVNIPLQ